MKTVVFVDGFNLFHSLDAEHPHGSGLHPFNGYKWLDIKKLATLFIHPNDVITEVLYFSALATWDPGKVQRHQIYLEALRSTGVKTILGAFQMRDQKCRICKKVFKIPEEKKTDVNIAINLLRKAFRDDYEKALLISGDSDLVPAIQAVKSEFPQKRMEVIIPVNRRAKLLKQVTHFSAQITSQHLAGCQFSNPLVISPSRTIHKPPTWI